MWILLAAALAVSADLSTVARGAKADATDRQAHTIALPAGKTLAIEVTIGTVRIEGRDLSGTLRLETGIGSVTLTATRLSANGLLRLRAFNGDVRLSLAERPADARILALALNGPIKSDIPLTTRDTWGPRWGEATLGKGEPVISIDVVTGSIEIKSP